MNAFEIQKHLGQHPWADRLLVYEEISSTNTLLKTLGQQGAPCGTVIVADHQSAGRGRMGRSFLSPRGTGVYLSALIRPQAAPSQIMHLTCAAAVAMCDAVEAATGIRPGIKWTNDLVIGKQKLGGILTELSLDPQTQQVDYAVIGVGINCTQQPHDFDITIQNMATSLHIATGKAIDRNRLTAEIIRSTHRLNAELLSKKAQVIKQYELDCVTIGQQIQVVQGSHIRYGNAIGIDDDGGLIVSYTDGETRTVTSGEVSIRGMYGYV